MTLTEMEDAADENAAHLLALIEQGQRSNLATWVDGRTRTELAWMVLALGHGYLQQEAENTALHVRHGVLVRQNETLDTANEGLFAERKQLMEKIAELRSILNQRAAKVRTGKGRLAA